MMNTTESEMRHIGEIIDQEKKRDVRPLLTGVRFLDKILGGYYPGELTTICGGEDSGKTAFVIKQLNLFAVDQHIPTLLVLHGMNTRSFLASMVAYYCSIETSNVHEVLNSVHRQEVADYLQMLSDAPLFVVDYHGDSNGRFIDMLQDIILKHGIKIAFFDEAILYYSDEGRHVPGQMKMLALRMNIPVVATCCTWNYREGPEGVKPSLIDLSGYFEKIGSDVVLGMIKYEIFHIYEDEHGHDLHDMIALEILKHKGRIVNRRCLMTWWDLYLRGSQGGSTDSLQHQEEAATGNATIKRLIDTLDLQTDN